jgi:hypothetical protein
LCTAHGRTTMHAIRGRGRSTLATHTTPIPFPRNRRSACHHTHRHTSRSPNRAPDTPMSASVSKRATLSAKGGFSTPSVQGATWNWANGGPLPRHAARRPKSPGVHGPIAHVTPRGGGTSEGHSELASRRVWPVCCSGRSTWVEVPNAGGAWSKRWKGRHTHSAVMPSPPPSRSTPWGVGTGTELSIKKKYPRVCEERTATESPGNKVLPAEVSLL